MLQYILRKQHMDQPDRNLIRRILVAIFDEELIHSGSKDFINHIEYLQTNSECSKARKVIRSNHRKISTI
jgi:hypothetical protein